MVLGAGKKVFYTMGLNVKTEQKTNCCDAIKTCQIPKAVLFIVPGPA